jgi:hypothetical protein
MSHPLPRYRSMHRELRRAVGTNPLENPFFFDGLIFFSFFGGISPEFTTLRTFCHSSAVSMLSIVIETVVLQKPNRQDIPQKTMSRTDFNFRHHSYSPCPRVKALQISNNTSPSRTQSPFYRIPYDSKTYSYPIPPKFRPLGTNTRRFVSQYRSRND